MIRIPLFTFLLAGTISSQAASTGHSFKKQQLTDEFWAEGACPGDFNHDGKMDVASGPYWYEGPDYKKRHEYSPANATFQHKKEDGKTEALPGFEGAKGVNNAYSESFLMFTYDFNSDGWDDILVYGFPGKEAIWYENPKGRDGHWQRHVILNIADNESPGFADVNGDGKPDLVCCSEGYIGYATADWKRPDAPWKFHPVSPKSHYQRFTHGIGAGDVNGDGHIDIIEKDGWWEQPSSLAGDPVWKKHEVAFAANGAQMVVYDVNGDGLNDVITSINAHGYGLAWYEQSRKDGEISFTRHNILEDADRPNKDGISFSQLHSLAVVDIDGDGLKDIITGKRFWAHGNHGDPNPNSPAVLYWFQLTRPAKGKAEFVPHLVDSDSGVGTQVYVGPISKKGVPDILVGNKKGLFIFEHDVKRKVWWFPGKQEQRKDPESGRMASLSTEAK